MLQIISGKFYKFKKKNIYITDAKGIAYSNFSWVKSIDTCTIKLEPVETHHTVSSWVLSYQNKMEIDERQGTQVVRTGDSVIIQQFLILCILGLNTFFNIDRNVVEINCREKPRSSDDQFLPSKLIPDIFNSKKIGTRDKIDNFIKLVDKVIGLPRKHYKVVITSIKNLTDSLQVLNYNFDLAYSMLIYSLESISQNFDDYTSKWDDFFPEIKGKLETELERIEPNRANNIRNILLKQRNFRLQRRFIEFIFDNITDNFFVEDAEKIEQPIKKSDLQILLKNSYGMRSGFVHQLQPVLHQLKIPHIANAEVFNWDNQPYFTYKGLYRLTRHIILNFISKQDYLKTEKYNWKAELPGLVEFKLAPQYWIGNSNNFNIDSISHRFSGFLNLLQKNLVNNESMIDLSDLLKKYKTLIPNANDKQKSIIISMYALYNYMLKDEYQISNFKELLDKYDSITNVCTIEMMIAHLLLSGKFPFEINECVSEYEKYTKIRFRNYSLNIPDLIELFLISEISNMYLRINDLVNFKEWNNYLYLEAAGKTDIQNLIKEAKANKIELNFETFFGKSQNNKVS